jgi:hypothetical protein
VFHGYTAPCGRLSAGVKTHNGSYPLFVVAPGKYINPGLWKERICQENDRLFDYQDEARAGQRSVVVGEGE